MLKLIYFTSFFKLILTSCNYNEYFCSSINQCINKNISCLSNCDLCMTRQRNGENIACINDCYYETSHLTNNCLDNNCEMTECPEGFIVEKKHCHCNCIPDNIICNRQYLCPKITPLSIPEDNIQGFTVYEISVILKYEAYNIYVIYGDENNNMIIPPSYQVHQHLGTNLGGINPILLEYVHDSIFDSWFTISVIDGDDMGYINSIGINWDDWSQDEGLIISNGAIFINDPILKLSNTNEYVIAHLTLNDREEHLLKVNINGKIKEEGDISVINSNSFNEENIIFNILRKQNN